MLKVIDKKSEIMNTKKELLCFVLDPTKTKFIMGSNELTDTILDVYTKKNIEITGIVDDFTSNTEYRGHSIFRTHELPKEALVISCVIDGRLITAIDNLRRSGIYNILTYLDLHMQFPDLFKQVRFCENNVNDIVQNEDKYHWLYSILNDDYSKQTLNHILDFRFNYNVDAMRFFPFQLENQYFDSIIKFDNQEVFVDCGGFDGETTLSFISQNPTYNKIHYFEPSLRQFNISKNKLSKFSSIEYFNMATYSHSTTLTFNPELGSSSGISSNGNVTVQAVKLDDVIKNRITYIKLDVEGAELATLEGAEQLIRKYKPRLAVCVYHDQTDFWKIPQLVLSYQSEYKVYIRHYTEGLLETVMYFV